MASALQETDLDGALRAGLGACGIEQDLSLERRFAHLLGLLDKWNQAFNLTAVRDPVDMVTKHVLDSLSAQPFLTGTSVLDVGTGAGFPGLPLAIVEPRRHFTLLDSGGKKIRFVRHAVGELALDNVSVEHIRAETFTPADLYDSVISRAFASLGDFVQRCGRLVATGGKLLAMKGRVSKAEFRGLPPGWVTADIVPLDVPGIVGERHMVVIERRG